MASLPFFCLYLLSLVGTIAKANEGDNPYLVYSHSGGPDVFPGLYGGHLKGQMDNDLRQEVLTCVGTKTGLNISSVSFDVFEKKVVFMHMTDDNNHITLVRTEPCRQLKGHCAKDVILDSQLPQDAGIIKIGPVAAHRGSTYFIFRQCVNNRFSMSIRKLTINSECASPYPRFDVNRCSTVINVYATIDGCNSLPETYVPLNNLLVQENSQRQLLFIFQVLLNSRTTEFVTVSHDGRVTVIATSIPDIQPTTRQLAQSGGISFHPDVEMLCWSDIQSIYCGKWGPGKVMPNKTQILKPQEVSRVCDELTNEDLRKVVTGVTIVNIDPLEVYFGCHGNYFGQGGAGKVRFVNDHYVVEKLKDARGQLHAGSLLVTNCPADIITSTGLPVIHKKVFYQVFLTIVILVLQ